MGLLDFHTWRFLTPTWATSPEFIPVLIFNFTSAILSLISSHGRYFQGVCFRDRKGNTKTLKSAMAVEELGFVFN
jgi:hypothetical protein